MCTVVCRPTGNLENCFLQQDLEFLDLSGVSEDVRKDLLSLFSVDNPAVLVPALDPPPASTHVAGPVSQDDTREDQQPEVPQQPQEQQQEQAQQQQKNIVEGVRRDVTEDHGTVQPTGERPPTRGCTV